MLTIETIANLPVILMPNPVYLHRSPGFTLIEMAVVIVVMGILISMMMPSYQHFIRRTHYSEILEALMPYRLGVESCYQYNHSLNRCQAGHYGIPKSGPVPDDSLVARIEVKQGIIHAWPKNRYGIHEQDDYILAPHVQYDTLIWQSYGGSVDAGYAH